jgi:hypothetical protein
MLLWFSIRLRTTIHKPQGVTPKLIQILATCRFYRVTMPFFLEGKRYFPSKSDQKYFSKYILHEDQGENSDGFSVDLITIQLDNLLCGCLSRDKYGNVLLNKRTELVDDFNIN